jgi:hypothetical protein
MSMSRLGRLARRLVIVWGIAAGCDGGGAPPTDTPAQDPAAAQAAALVVAMKSDLQSLADLRVVGIDDLVVKVPEAANCYGGAPCAELVSNPAVAAEYARQAPRLHQLTSMAQQLAAATELPPAGANADTAADLAALNNLAIVHFGGLVTVQPVSSPDCYNAPCPDEIKRVNAENSQHADLVHALAAGSAYLAP